MAGTADEVKAVEAIKSAEKAVNSGNGLGAITPDGLMAFAKISDAVESLPSNLKVKRVREGSDPTKVAIIGRSMGDRTKGLVGVNDAASHFEAKGINVETFKDENAWGKFLQTATEYRQQTGNTRLPASEVVKTEMYKSNKVWAEKLKTEGYTVVDLGDPNELYEFSAFYAIEKKIIFGE